MHHQGSRFVTPRGGSCKVPRPERTPLRLCYMRVGMKMLRRGRSHHLIRPFFGVFPNRVSLFVSLAKSLSRTVSLGPLSPFLLSSLLFSSYTRKGRETPLTRDSGCTAILRTHLLCTRVEPQISPEALAHGGGACGRPTGQSGSARSRLYPGTPTLAQSHRFQPLINGVMKAICINRLYFHLFLSKYVLFYR